MTAWRPHQTVIKYSRICQYSVQPARGLFSAQVFFALDAAYAKADIDLCHLFNLIREINTSSRFIKAILRLFKLCF